MTKRKKKGDKPEEPGATGEAQAAENEAPGAETTGEAQGADEAQAGEAQAGETATDEAQASPESDKADKADPGADVLKMRGRRSLRTVGEIAADRLEELVQTFDSLEEAKERYEKSKSYTKSLKDDLDEKRAAFEELFGGIAKMARGDSDLPLLAGMNDPALPADVAEVVEALRAVDYEIDPIVVAGMSSADKKQALDWAKATETKRAYLAQGDELKASMVTIPALPVMLRRDEVDGSHGDPDAGAGDAGEVEGAGGAAVIDEAVESAAKAGTAPAAKYVRVALVAKLGEERAPALDEIDLWHDDDKIEAYLWAQRPDAEPTRTSAPVILWPCLVEADSDGADDGDDRFVTCPGCGNEQADMGVGVACEQCGEAIPDADDSSDEAGE